MSIYSVRDGLRDARISAVQVVATLVQLRLGKLHHRPVAEPLAPVVLLDKGPVPPYRQGIEHREELILGEVLGPRGTGFSKQPAQAGDPQRLTAQRAVVASEQQEQIVQVPQGVVDGRGGQQQQLFRCAPHEPVQCRVPGVPDVAVGVLVDRQNAPTAMLGKLAVLGQFLVGDHLAG